MTTVEALKLVLELAEQNRLAALEVDSDELAREHVHQQEACEKVAEIIETSMTHPVCKNCHRSLEAPAEPEAGQWIVRCFECGAKNIIAVVARRRRTPVLSIAGWRD